MLVKRRPSAIAASCYRVVISDWPSQGIELPSPTSIYSRLSLCKNSYRSISPYSRHYSSSAESVSSLICQRRNDPRKDCMQRTFQDCATLIQAAAMSTMDTHQRSVDAACRLSRPLPAGTIDTHMHIIPPDFERFPILSTAQYKPTPHTLDDATSFYTQTSGLGIAQPRMVLTQVSIYGKDNSALLSGLAELGPNGRGVVECDPQTVSTSQLEKWWSQGVRGIRINLVSVGRTVTEEELQQLLQSYVDKLTCMKMEVNRKWVIEMYVQLSSLSMLLSVLPNIRNADAVRWCLDHFGGLSFKGDNADFEPDDDPYLIPGFSALVMLLTEKSLPEVCVKISAAYRVDADYPSAKALKRLGVVGRELIDKAEDRVMWASDWPHTRFEKVDSVPFVEACYDWCGDGERGIRRREKLFKENAELLWAMERIG